MSVPSASFDGISGFGGRTVLIQDIERFVAAVRRQIAVTALTVAIALTGGVLFVATRTPLYTASSLVLIDNRHVRPVEQEYDATSVPDIAASLVDSQVEVVTSAKVAEAVIAKLGLMNDPRFTDDEAKGLLGWLKAAIFGPAVPAGESQASIEAMKTRRAVERLQANLEAHRVGRTMVLQISYTAASPAEAAAGANAFAEAYLGDQLNSKYEATKRASQWLEERKAALKEKALSADLAIQKFRAEHGLILSGGKLVNEQQLTEINTQLVTARGERARAEARYQRIQEILKTHETKAIVSEAIGNTIIEQLRSKYLDVAKREAELEIRVGPDHLSVVGLRADMAQYERQMFAELGRLAEAYRSEVNIDQAKEASLEDNLAQLVGVSAKENKSLVDLRELEREAEAYRNLYQSYMQKYQESLQQQSFPIIEARIITSAFPPFKSSYPKKLPMLVIFGFLGAAAGAAAGGLREFREKGFLREDQVRAETGLECLGLLPLVGDAAPGKAAKPAAKEAGPARLPNRARIAAGGGATALASFSPASAMMSFALDNPGSVFTETMLAVKLAADIKLSGSASKTIGILSGLPSEGKSLFAMNFASVLARIGAKTLLIDADIRGPELTRQLAPQASAGLIQAVIGAQRLDELVMRDERTSLLFLPSVVGARVPHTSELLASQGMKSLLGEARRIFDYIVIDLPPFGPVVDVRAISPQVQAFAYITEWRKTPRKIARDMLERNDDVRSKCLGIVLNKVDTKRIELFEDRGSRYYYYKRYKNSYYIEQA